MARTVFPQRRPVEAGVLTECPHCGRSIVEPSETQLVEEFVVHCAIHHPYCADCSTLACAHDRALFVRAYQDTHGRRERG